jgi:uncharacterized protein
MISPDLLQILCCPETHQPLVFADAATVAGLNEQITAGKLINRAGKPVTEKIDGALLRKDRKYAYVIRGDIPVMLINEAILFGA